MKYIQNLRKSYMQIKFDKGFVLYSTKTKVPKERPIKISN